MQGIHLMNSKEGGKIIEIMTSYERKGREEGRKEGQDKGRKKEKIGVAKNLVQKGMDEAFVEEVTGLTMEEIEKLKKESE